MVARNVQETRAQYPGECLCVAAKDGQMAANHHKRESPHKSGGQPTSVRGWKNLNPCHSTFINTVNGENQRQTYAC